MDKEAEESLKERRERRKMERENKKWLEEDKDGKETGLQKLMRNIHRKKELGKVRKGSE